MSGLDQIFGALPYDPPPRFTRPVTTEGVRESTYRPGKTDQESDVEEPPLEKPLRQGI